MSSRNYSLVSGVLVLLLAGAQGLLFSRADKTAVSDGRAIEQECLALADAGSCEFYTCFERRLPCGREWYILRQGLYYCNKVQRLKDNFSPAGQQFLDNAQQCMTSALKDSYQLEYVSCHDLEHGAVSNMTRCSTENNFCSVYNGDSSNFMNIYEPADLFSHGAFKIWRAITSLIATCVRSRAESFGTEAATSILNAFNRLRDIVSDN